MTAIPTHDAPPLVAHVLEHLEHVTARPTGRAWRATCPVPHGPENDGAELLITYARDGRVMLECQAGCAIEDIVEHIGLKIGDLYPGLTDADEYLTEPGAGNGGNGASDSLAETSHLPQAIRALDAPPPRPIEWIVNDLFTAGEIGLLVGDGGSFKSTAAINMAAALAGGYPVWNRFAAPARSSLIISAEDSIDIVMMRLNAFVAGHEWDRTKVLGNIHLFASTDVTLATASWQQHILEEAKRVGAGLIILDPFAELINGDENSNTEVRPIIKFLRALGRDTGAAVVVVHHAGKQGQDKRTLDRIRGASALPSAARSILFFDYQPNGAGVAVEHLKMNRTPRLEPFILTRTVDHDRLNRALWYSATLNHVEARTAQMNRAEAFVVAQVTAAPRVHTTSDLRKSGAGLGIRAEDVGSALNNLYKVGRIGFESGPRGSKKWFAHPTSGESKPSNDPVQFELGKVGKVEE